MLRIVLLGNHQVPYSSESHHALSLEELGHQVVRLQEGKATGDDIVSATSGADLFVWIHTHSWPTEGIDYALAILKYRQIPVVAYHLDLYMGLERWQEYQHDPYLQSVDHFFTVDRLMADWLNNNTPTKGHYLPAAVFGPECYLTQTTPDVNYDVVFVGQRNYHPEWPYRPRLIFRLEEMYGDRFIQYGGDGAGTIRGRDLNQVYSNSKVVVGDSLCLSFDYPDYFSDRVFETLGRGGMLVHPRIPGLERYFTDGEHLVLYDYNDFDQLKGIVDHLLAHPQEREEIRRKGHEHVKNNHTYQRRWEQILDTLGLS